MEKQEELMVSYLEFFFFVIVLVARSTFIFRMAVVVAARLEAVKCSGRMAAA